MATTSKKKHRVGHPQITRGQLRDLTCAYCGQGFQIEQYSRHMEDNQVPFVQHGLMEVRESDGTVTYYHGYQGRGCFQRSGVAEETTATFNDEALGDCIEVVMRKFFAEQFPGRTLTSLKFKVEYSWADPEKGEQGDSEA